VTVGELKGRIERLLASGDLTSETQVYLEDSGVWCRPTLEVERDGAGGAAWVVIMEDPDE
jgi:hypothetical protein